MNNINAKNPSILIIGAGLGGLSLAQGLKKSGFNVKVFERDESPSGRTQGYRITLRELGLNALSALLPTEILNKLNNAKVSDLGDGFTFADEQMNRLFEIPQGAGSAAQFLRSELRNLLLEGITIEWNKKLINFEEKEKEEGEGQITAFFEDGSRAKGDFLIGCDGGSSIVRELLPSVYGDKMGELPKIIYSGRIGMAGQVDRTPEWDALLPFNKKGPVRFIGPNSQAMFVCFSERVDRSPTVYWGITEEVADQMDPKYQFDGGGPEGQLRILDRCKEIVSTGLWHENLKKLIFMTPAAAMIAPWFLRTTQFPKLTHLTQSTQAPMVPFGKVTLLGDAAHSMPPEGGMGGSHVLEDARILSELMKSSEKPMDWPKLIANYELQMFERTRKAVEESEKLAQTKFR